MGKTYLGFSIQIDVFQAAMLGRCVLECGGLGMLENAARDDGMIFDAVLYYSCSHCTANNVQFIPTVDLGTSDRYPGGYPEERGRHLHIPSKPYHAAPRYPTFFKGDCWGLRGLPVWTLNISQHGYVESLKSFPIRFPSLS
jgi:hypothetical protein